MKMVYLRNAVAMGLGLFTMSGAYALPNGIAGYSGNPSSCTSCHGGGTNPTVSFVGPASVAPGTTTKYIFRIAGLSNLTAGVDISAVGGTLQNLMTTTRLLSGEIVQSNNLAATNGVVDVSFNVVAPASGTVKLYASGMSASGSGTGGDGTSVGSLSIPVIAVANQAPVANAGGPYMVTLGTPVNFDGSLSKDADGTIASYAWNFGDGTTGTGAKVSHSYLNAGTYNVSLIVTDNLGLKSMAAAATATVNPANNLAPVANAGGPYTVAVGTPVNLDGSLSKDADGTIASYAWTFGDGTTGTGAKVSHSYLNAGVYNVSLIVTDNLGLKSMAATTTATVNPPNNLLPVANAGGPYSALIAVPVNFNGSLSKDPDGTIAAYSWNFGDGATGTGATPTHAYVKEGTYTTTLKVTDNSGATAMATATVTIRLQNGAPVADAGGPYSASRRGRVVFDASGSSDADGMIVSYHWDFGDGMSANRARIGHRYPQSGTYDVVLTVTDDSGASSQAKIQVIIP